MDAVAFIFVRGGSKGLPGKNIKVFSGKPLIAWSIDVAKAVKRIRRVIVSTDSEDIAKVAIKYGAEVPFFRPRELALDDSPELDAWKHALGYINSEEGGLPEAMVSLPATSPLRSVDDVDRCLDCFYENDADVVLTMTEARRNPYFNMVEKKKDGTLKIAIDSFGNIARRQDAPVLYDLTTVAYVARPKFVMQNKTLFSGNVVGVRIPEERSIDIDTQLDFELAEFFYTRSLQK